MKKTNSVKYTKLYKQNEKYGYLMISPILIGILLFTLVPVVFSLYISFTDWNMLSDYQFVGLENYKNIFEEDTLKQVGRNTLIYCVIAIPGTIIAGLFLSLILNINVRGIPIYRSIFFLPNITTTVAVCLVWTWLYNDRYGLFNNLLHMVGLEPVKWLTSKKMAMPSIAIMSIWQNMGYDMIILTAGLKNIDPTYYEAAKIDGANSIKSFFNITLPLLTPTLFFLIVTHIISFMQMFDASFIMTQGGPGHASRTIVMQIYYTAFEFFRMGEASAYAWILFVVVFLMTIVQFKFQSRWVSYDA